MRCRLAHRRGRRRGLHFLWPRVQEGFLWHCDTPKHVQGGALYVQPVAGVGTDRSTADRERDASHQSTLAPRQQMSPNKAQHSTPSLHAERSPISASPSKMAAHLKSFGWYSTPATVGQSAIKVCCPLRQLSPCVFKDGNVLKAQVIPELSNDVSTVL